MKRSTFLGWLPLCILCCMAWPRVSSAEPRTAFYYGSPIPADLLVAYDQIVVEPGEIESLDGFAAPGSTAPSGTRGAVPVAYFSVGEIAKSTSEAERVPAGWVLAENAAWSSLVMDLAHPGYRRHLLARYERLWRAGYRRFFLDTLDSYRLASEGARADRAEAALVPLILEMKRRHPEVRLILNRGFELLPRLARAVSGVVAESLFDRWDAAAQRYTRVPESDRAWLLERLRQARDVHGLPVTVIDYRPEHERTEARETARKILALGFEPWVTNATLTSIGIGSLEILPRRVLILGNERRETGAEAAPPEPLRLLAPVLEYLGYVPEYRDAPEDWSELGLEDGYQGVITWFSQPRVPAGYVEWMRAQRERGLRFVVFGVPGFDIAGDEARELGLSLIAPAAMEPTRVVARDASIGFEAPPPRRPFDGPVVELARRRGTRVHLRLRDAAGRSGVAIATTPWGGFALSHVLALRGLHGERAWVVDPFAFLTSALGLPRAPMPSVTTQSGRRLTMLLVRPEGLGWPAAHGQPKIADALGEWLSAHHPWPHSVALAADGENLDAADLRAAEELARLPFFQAATLRPGATRARGPGASLTEVSGMFLGTELLGPIAPDSLFLLGADTQAYPFEQVIAALEYTEAPRRLKPVLVDYHGFMASSAAGRATLAAVYEWLESRELYPLHVREYEELARAFREQVVAREITRGSHAPAFHFFGGERLSTVRAPLELGVPALEGVSAPCVRRSLEGHYVSFAPHTARRLEFTAKPLDRPHLVQSNGALRRFEVAESSPESARIDLELAGHLPLQLSVGGLPPGSACELVLHSGRVQGSVDGRGELALRLPVRATAGARLICPATKGSPSPP